MITHEVIQRLREDVTKLRTDKYNQAIRWLPLIGRWRWKRDIADDIEHLIDIVTGSKGLL